MKANKTAYRVKEICARSGLPPEEASRILREAGLLWNDLSCVHGLTKTWRPWFLLAALFQGVARRSSQRYAARLLRPYRDLMPSSPAGGAGVLRRALEALTEGPGASVAGTRNEKVRARRMLALRMAAVVGLIPEEADAKGATLQAVRVAGRNVELFYDPPSPSARAAVEKSAVLWKRVLRRTLVMNTGGRAERALAARDPLPSDPLRTAGAKVLSSQLQSWMARPYGLPLREDPEFVHELRVCIRRIRTTLRVFGDALGPWAKNARLRWAALARALGDVRDTDVLYAFLARYLEHCPPSHQPAVRRLMQAPRRSGRTHMRRAGPMILSPAHQRVLRTCRRNVNNILDPPAATDTIGDPLETVLIAEAAPLLLRKRLKTLYKNPETLADCTPDQLHDLRIACKKLRYAAETVSPIYPNGLKVLTKPAAELQGCLGDVHDADAYREWISRVRERRRARADGQAEDAAMEALLAHVDAWRRENLLHAESVWRHFTAAKTQKVIRARVRSPFPVRYPAVQAAQPEAIMIGGKPWTADVWITADGKVRKRKTSLAKQIYGTRRIIGPAELWRVIRPRPGILYVGTGHTETAELTGEAREYLRRMRIPVFLAPTPEAAEAFNKEGLPKAGILYHA